MILDLAQRPALLDAPDVAVVGSGPVGILVAVSLARAGKRVVLCECGGDAPELRMQALNQAEIAGRAHLGVTEGRPRLLGGASTVWGGQLVAFQEADFSARPWLDAPAWPVSRADLAPYFAAAAKLLGLASVDGEDLSVWRELGHEPADLGAHLDLILTRWMKQPHFPALFETELRSNPKLEVLTHACVVGFEAEGDRIVAIRLRAPDGRPTRLAARQFVLACGAIETSRLMLSAALDAPSLPWARNRWIGRGFQDHLDMRAATVSPIDRRRFDDAFSNIFLRRRKYSPKIVLTPQTQAERGVTNIAGVMVYESSLSDHLNQLKMVLKTLSRGRRPRDLGALPGHLSALRAVWRPLILRYLRDRRMFNPADLGISLRVHCEQKPLERSRVAVKLDERDAQGLHRGVLDWQVDGMEIETIAVFSEAVKARLEQMGLARLEIAPGVVARDRAALAAAEDSNHHCGGLRMAACVELGVVDRHARVFGVRNLFVAGAAIFPTSSFANPTFTAMAFGLRLVDHLTGAAA